MLALADDAGYSPGPRVLFGVLAALAVGAAAVWDPAAARRALRSPVVVVLLVLGAFGALSALWTIGLPGDAWRWGLVTAGFAALIVATAVLGRDERSRTAIAVGLAIVAVGIAIVGLVAAATTSDPLAHREAGDWRPASTFQYAPALALLMVSVLPVLLRGMCRGGRGSSTAAAFGAAVAAAVFGLAVSRVELAFAVAVCAAAAVWPRPTVGAPRTTALAAVALVAGTALGAYAIVGGYVPLAPAPDTTARLLELGAVLLAGTALWVLARPLLQRGGRAAAAVVAVLALAGPLAAIAKPPARLTASRIVLPRAPGPPSPARHRHRHPTRKRDTLRDGILHGRLKIWRAAWRTFEDRPLQGGGADSFFFASARHQGASPVFYAHDLPLELGAELGILGLLLALTLYAAGALAIWRARDGPALWLFGPAATAFLAANLVDWPWHFAGSGAVWAIGLGALIAVPRTAPPPGQPCC